MYYLVSLAGFVLGSIILSLILGRVKNTKAMNIFFALIIFGTYIAYVVFVYLDVGWQNKNFINTLPTANISPFMFFIAPLCVFAPKAIKKHFLLLISLLSIVMILLPAYNCVQNYLNGIEFAPHLLLDYGSHFVMLLWGIYLVRSNQVELNFKSFSSSLSTMLCILIVFTTLNSIFDTSFFGLSLNGKHNIYGYVLVDNSYLSLLIYLGGLVALLFIGYGFCKIIKKLHKPRYYY